MLLVYLLLIVILGVVGGYNSKMKLVIQSLSRFIAKDNNLNSQNEFQEIITPKLQLFFNSALFIVSGLIIIGFFIFVFYVPIFGAAFYIVAEGIAIKIAPKKLSTYIEKIKANLSNQTAVYSKQGDCERSEKLKDVRAIVVKSYEKITEILGPDSSVEQFVEIVSDK